MDKIKRFLIGKLVANWVWIFIMVLIALFAMFGWRITFNPKLENSWNAISAIGNWAAAIISGIAIWFAVAAPKQIAAQQNKIALFEKRFESYSVFLKYISFAASLSGISSSDYLKNAFKFNFVGDGDEFDLEKIVGIIKRDENLMMAGLFLFSNFSGSKEIEKIVKNSLSVVQLVKNEHEEFSEDDKKKIDSFCEICMEFEKNNMEEMRKQIMIG